MLPPPSQIIGGPAHPPPPPTSSYAFDLYSNETGLMNITAENKALMNICYKELIFRYGSIRTITVRLSPCHFCLLCVVNASRLSVLPFNGHV